MKLALDHRLAQGEEIHLGNMTEDREMRVPKDLGAVRILTRANMQPPGSRTLLEVGIPLGTVDCRNGVWTWTSPVRGIELLSVGTTLSVGRDALQADNQAISRNHYSLTVVTGDTLVIRDENSTNGTWVVKLDR